MKKINVMMAILFVFIFALALVQPAQALPYNPISLNARFTHWQEVAAVIHIMVWPDAGRPGNPPAIVNAGEPLLFGFEWGSAIDVEHLQSYYIDNPNTNITVSVDGNTPFSVKGNYQAPFVAATQSGPAWSWDHDGDGPGDGDGDGVSDWSGAVLFFRYLHPGLAPGPHTFVFTVTEDPYSTSSDTISVLVIP